MQHDTVIWEVISPSHGGFCSYRRTIPQVPTKFCKNPYNVLGLCTPKACPLANSQYATITEHHGKCYLMIKTIERAHSPSKHWEKIELPSDYMSALNEIDRNLAWWPKFNKHKCKLRLTKIHQYLIRSRKLALTIQPKLARISKRYERQQVKREAKAEKAAKVSLRVKEELIERLQAGVYEGIYNFPSREYNEVVDEMGQADDSDESEEDDDELKELADEDDFVAASDIDDMEDTIPDPTDEKMMERMYELEYEHEPGMEMETQAVSNWTSRSSGSKKLRKLVLPKRSKKKEEMEDDDSEGGVEDDVDIGSLPKMSVLGKRRKKQGRSEKKKKRRVAVGYE